MDPDPICYMIIKQNERPFANISELSTDIEKGGENSKINAVAQAIRLMLAGEPATKLTIPIIRFAAPTKSKILKKYLLLYYEICPKILADGSTRQEMVLLCNNLLNDLSHPNEYIRGCTLRFLTKVNEKEILEPLIPSILNCLEHRHAYVRKNALRAIHHIYIMNSALIPETVETVYNHLSTETDDTCKRNSLLMLLDTDPSLAIKYLHSVADDITSLEETFQCAAAESIKRFKTKRLTEKPFLIDCLKRLMLSSYESVRYEAAGALITLAPESVPLATLAISCYVELLKNETDNSAKLAILSKIEHALQISPGALGESLMDIFRAEDSADTEVSEKIIKLIIHSTTSSNADNIMKLFGEELMRPSSRTVDEEVKFKYMIIGAIMFCAMKFSSTRPKAVQLLIETMYNTSIGNYINLVAHVQKIVSASPKVQETVASNLLSSFGGEDRLSVVIGCVWMIGEYIKDAKSINDAIDLLMSFLTNTKLLDTDYVGNINFAPLSIQKLKNLSASLLYKGSNKDPSSIMNYKNDLNVSEPYSYGYLNDNKWNFISRIASALSKLYINYKACKPPQNELRMAKAKVCTIHLQLLHVVPKLIKGKIIIIFSRLIKKLKEYPSYAADKYVYDRVMYALLYMEKDSTDNEAANFMELALMNSNKYIPDSKVFCDVLLSTHTAQEQEMINTGVKKPLKQIQIRLLKASAFSATDEHNDEDLNEALGVGKYACVKCPFMEDGKTISLTGLSDPVYVETNVTISGFNCILDIFAFNQTFVTLQNVTLEFKSQGNLIEISRVGEFSLGPQGFHCVKVTAKVTSTNLGVITGNIMYSTSVSTDVSVINLDKIFINMAEFMRPATCTLAEFQRMWYDFEWENKINIETEIRDLRDYLKYFVEATRMKCLSSDDSITDEYGVLSANLYARSIFGEDSLVNISADKDKNGTIKGSVRIRSQVQGVAMSLGDIINNFQSKRKAVLC